MVNMVDEREGTVHSPHSAAAWRASNAVAKAKRVNILQYTNAYVRMM